MPEAPLSPRNRRTVLQQLSRDRLAELTTKFALDVADRRSIQETTEAS
jgi:hypothetical protein